MAKRKADTHEAPKAGNLAELPLLSFIPAVTEGYGQPEHLRPLVEALDSLPFTTRRLVCDAPRRHGKSTTVHHAIAKWLIKYPKLSVIYYTYGLQFAYEMNRTIQSIYLRAGGREGDRSTQAHWTTPEGGGVFATSRDGSLTGRGGDVLVIDDPLKNRAEAEALDMRNQIDAAIRNDAIPCLKKNSPVLLVASRYHTDDPSGRMLKRGADHIHLKAINTRDDGTYYALWPEERPLEYLTDLREEIGEYAFASNYQGEPTPPASALFPGATRFDPSDGLAPARVTIGVDLAYSAGRTSDYTAIGELADMVDHVRLTNVTRGQWPITQVAAELRKAQARYPKRWWDEGRVRFYSYVSGPERGVFDLLFQMGIPIHRLPARYNKVVRAQRSSQAWAAGRIRIPDTTPEPKWLDPFLSELRYFTGVDDATDDQVDMLVSGFDALEGGRTSPLDLRGGFLFGRRCM